MVFQNAFVYQPKFYTLELKNCSGCNYDLSWKWVCKLKPSHIAFMHSIKLYGYRMTITFDKDPLAVEQNNHTTKIVNAYIHCQ